MLQIKSLDAAGRVHLGELRELLGWPAPALLSASSKAGWLVVSLTSQREIAGVDDPVVQDRAPTGAMAMRIDPSGRLRIPAGIRVRLGLRVRGRVLLGADATSGLLVAASDRVVEDLVDAALSAPGGMRRP